MTAKKTMVWALVGLLGVGAAVTWAGEGAATGDDGVGRAGRFWDGRLGKMIKARLGRLAMLKEELGVTDEQRERLGAIRRENRARIAPQLKSVVAKKRALRDAVLADEPDEKAIRDAANELGKAIGDVAVAASGIVGEVKDVLTAEQIEALLDFRREREDKFLDRLDRGPVE